MAVIEPSYLATRRNQEDSLLTFLIVCNRDRELFLVLQTRVESTRQIHAGVRERTLRDGVRSSAYRVHDKHCNKDNGGNSNSGIKNVTTVPLGALKFEGLYTRLPPAAT